MKNKLLLAPLLLLTTTTKSDLVFHLGFHNPVIAASLDAAHNAVPNNGKFSFKLSDDGCQQFLVGSAAVIVIAVGAYYTYQYLNAPAKEVKKEKK